MNCARCLIPRVSDEFPPIHKDCQHAQLVCLECLLTALKSSEGKKACPTRGCTATWDSRMPDLEAQFASLQIDSTFEKVEVSSNTMCDVVCFDGRSTKINLANVDNLISLKRVLRRTFEVEEPKQRLLLGTVELKEGPLTPQGVVGGCTVYLVVRMLAFSPSELKKIDFVLTFDFPKVGGKVVQDALDGSCFIFNKKKTEGIADYRNKNNNNGVTHSGDGFNFATGSGKQTIVIELAKLDPKVSQLFFTLSAFNAKDMSGFGKPNVLLRDSEKGTTLSQYQIHQAANSKAVIMCSLTRTRTGWVVEEMGLLSDGFTENYEPLLTKITTTPGLIRED